MGEFLDKVIKIAEEFNIDEMAKVDDEILKINECICEAAKLGYTTFKIHLSVINNNESSYTNTKNEYTHKIPNKYYSSYIKNYLYDYYEKEGFDVQLHTNAYNTLGILSISWKTALKHHIENQIKGE